ncbi:hypothetical protein D6853_10965 [Butyrivibrio sp. X503]|uniref:hypothetical protein n=1 Tax=Butyrivibrio sp. X503 TaxID=2364878 RepID=UPI000EAA20BF|nr:hypothetical protein [Butyrivibrio sp. X503]RKM55240.1 hypothetical protein D6853_10965 [Butyrivibrio sp. X503]
MEKYDITDMYSFLPKKDLGLDNVKKIFLKSASNALNEIDGYTVIGYDEGSDYPENVMLLSQELISEKKKVAIVKKEDVVTAIVGYREIGRDG